MIGFGGSYGGMLASWARLKYPHVWDGAIAGSAPIVSFESMSPAVDPNFYAEGVTYDVSAAAGASDRCEPNLRKAFAGQALSALDPAAVRDGLGLCSVACRYELSALALSLHVSLSLLLALTISCVVE